MTQSPFSYDQAPGTARHSVKEEQIEYGFIGKLQSLKYQYREDIRDRAALERNFREHFEALNRVKLSDAEFTRLLDDIVTPDVFAAARRLRERNSFTRDDGTPLHYTLVNIKDWCKNTFEVVNQLRINTDYSHHRYDVLILINGVPCVQVELKTLTVNPRRAMEQIVDYKNDPGNGYAKTLLCFLQLFIVSNRTNTYYFANNNARHFAFNQDERFLPIYQFADEANQKISHLDHFAETFLAKCTLGEAISRYMVLVASEQKLLMMRPYQVYAVKAIVDCIHDNCGNGYIWHTTGSGKTLTSFKASTLLKDNPDIEKCLFVVDRKDLDRQTREEFNRFQEGCVEENTNTSTLVRRLLSDDYADKVIVTTIQKLGLALDDNSKRNQQQKKDGRLSYKEQLAPLQDKRIVFIFDECHRSQFGDNHKAIKAFFPKAQLFGFTGTPIFEDNASQEPKTGAKQRLESVMDFACGSGSLLLNVRKRMGPHGIGKIYGQEKNITTYNLARMNMLLHGVKDTEFEIFHGDTLTNEWDKLRELNPAKKPTFDAIVANPPFSLRWDATEAMADDVRFKNHGLAPKSAADFAFLLHGFHFLKDEGVMAIILPHGVLFRGGAEERIRKKLLLDGHIDTVIGLPANLFYSTGIPVCILVLKKCKKPDDVLFINAAEHFEKGKRQNQLSEAHIAKIIDTYQHRKVEDRYSRRVEMAEIEKNDFNLNISRYISTAVAEAEIDLSATHAELVKIESDIAAAKAKHNAFLIELGLKPLP